LYSHAVRRLERDVAKSDAALGTTSAARAEAFCGPARDARDRSITRSGRRSSVQQQDSGAGCAAERLHPRWWQTLRGQAGSEGTAYGRLGRQAPRRRVAVRVADGGRRPVSLTT
jgi:hypothetical protein